MEIMRIDNLSAMKPQARPEAEDPKLRKACQDFEALLVQQMLSRMRASLPKNDLFGSKDEEEVFRGMLDEEYAKDISASGSLGLGDMLYAQFSAAKKR